MPNTEEKDNASSSTSCPSRPVPDSAPSSCFVFSPDIGTTVGASSTIMGSSSGGGSSNSNSSANGPSLAADVIPTERQEQVLNNNASSTKTGGTTSTSPTGSFQIPKNTFFTEETAQRNCQEFGLQYVPPKECETHEQRALRLHDMFKASISARQSKMNQPQGPDKSIARTRAQKRKEQRPAASKDDDTTRNGDDSSNKKQKTQHQESTGITTTVSGKTAVPRVPASVGQGEAPKKNPPSPSTLTPSVLPPVVTPPPKNAVVPTTDGHAAEGFRVPKKTYKNDEAAKRNCERFGLDYAPPVEGETRERCKWRLHQMFLAVSAERKRRRRIKIRSIQNAITRSSTAAERAIVRLASKTKNAIDGTAKKARTKKTLLFKTEEAAKRNCQRFGVDYLSSKENETPEEKEERFLKMSRAVNCIRFKIWKAEAMRKEQQKKVMPSAASDVQGSTTSEDQNPGHSAQQLSAKFANGQHGEVNKETVANGTTATTPAGKDQFERNGQEEEQQQQQSDISTTVPLATTVAGTTGLETAQASTAALTPKTRTADASSSTVPHQHDAATANLAAAPVNSCHQEVVQADSPTAEQGGLPAAETINLEALKEKLVALQDGNEQLKQKVETRRADAEAKEVELQTLEAQVEKEAAQTNQELGKEKAESTALDVKEAAELAEAKAQVQRVLLRKIQEAEEKKAILKAQEEQERTRHQGLSRRSEEALKQREATKEETQRAKEQIRRERGQRHELFKKEKEGVLAYLA